MYGFRHATRLLALAVLAISWNAAAEQAYPSQPIRLVVPYPAGGGTDEVARIIAPRLAKELGRPVIIWNRGGAGGTIGVDYAANSKPDGYTLLLGHSGMIINLFVYPKGTFDPRKDLVPLGEALSQSSFLLVNPSVKANTARDLVQLAKGNPGKLNFSSPGSGSPFRLGMELFKRLTRTNIVHIPYNGGAAATNAVLSGDVQMIMSGTTGVSFVRSGQLRALATTGQSRAAALPDVPTLDEQGIHGFFMHDSWVGLFAPAGTPNDITAKLSQALHRALDDDALRKEMQTLNFDVVNGSPQTMAEVINREIPQYASFIHDNNIKFQ